MAETSGCGLRQRRALTLNADSGNQVTEGQTTTTPTTGGRKFTTLTDFKNKQQSFDIPVHLVDDCDEEEIAFDSEDEGPEEKVGQRPVTPTPLQDFGVSVEHSEAVPLTATEFLKVGPADQDCYTDVSDAESDNEEE